MYATRKFRFNELFPELIAYHHLVISSKLNI